MSSFQLSGVDHRPFQALFDQTDDGLQAQGIVRMQVDAQPGFPCRVSLQDAAVGEQVLLLPYWHHQVESPYRALGPIFVRQGASQAQLPPDTVPDYVSRRQMSLRAYDQAGMMLMAEVCEGTEVAALLSAWFETAAVAYIHLHNAKRGCFSCLAERAKRQ